MEDSSNNVELEEDQILNMPSEAFIHIFSYVPQCRRQNAVGLVCQKFYDLLCELEKDMHPLELNYQQIYDDDIFESIISSGRRFNELTINLKTCRVLESLERVKAVMQKFGSRIVKFQLCSSIQSETSEITESQLITILSCLPKVQEITLRNVCVRQSCNIDVEDLKLLELKKLVIDYCQFDTPAILNKIPADVLQELVFTFEPYDETHFQKFINRQSRIKKLEMFENDKITFDHLQLEHLKISSSIDFVAMINQQPKLKYLDFAITWIDDSIFSALCNLKYLEVVRTLIDQVSIREFKNLKNLSHLKELRLDSHSPYDCGHLLELSMMKCLPIEKLTLLYTERRISEEILDQMSFNYRRLKHFEIINRSIKIITTILDLFPSLESMLFDFFAIFGAPDDVLVVNDELRHENLKQLVVTNINANEVENSSALLKLLNSCPNLNRIMLSQLSGISSDDFKHIIQSHPHLTHLSLEFDDFEFNEDIIVFLISWAPKLVHLRLSGLSSFPTYSTLRDLFDEIFPNITFYKYSSGDGEIIMKKRNIPDWYLNFKLMDHF